MNIHATTLPVCNALSAGTAALSCTVAAHRNSRDKGNPNHG
ncbi:hypothetical protein GWL_25030 [Herbaspirillum sp. GW103]|nr:hypothetical protein GWL_25030 [Herbaspirillum sp. GW103]